MSKTILIAGIGTGSLGLELLKCVSLSPEFVIYGADSNPQAAGHEAKQFKKTFVTRTDTNDNYVQDLIRICESEAISFLVPGSEVTNKIVSTNQDRLRGHGIIPLVNSEKVFQLCSDKVASSNFLIGRGIPAAQAVEIPTGSELEFSRFPCVVKPVRDSGASNMVFLAENHEEAKFFVHYIANRGAEACVQEYIDGEEYTVGVMSDREGGIISSIALRRDLSSKLSRTLTYGNRVISSGWSQGDIDSYPGVRNQCEEIARVLKSTWALNIQGRLKNDIFYPFEINPRHSGTSYFRALSGVNEIVLGINNLLGEACEQPTVRPAVYYRVLSEQYFYKDQMNSDN
jgi:carbamoyl-phosphate synthase large subunit